MNGGAAAQTLVGCETWGTTSPEIRASVADSNGVVSAVRAAEALSLGLAPAPKEIRVDDFFNHYDTAAAAPVATGSTDLELSMALRARAIPNQYDLFVGVRAGTPPRPRSVLTIVVDTTPSMSGMAIARAKFALVALAGALRSGDKVTLLTTDVAQGETTFDVSDTTSELALLAEKLVASNEADVQGALSKAYAKANAHLDPTGLNRVVFVSDGAEPLSALPTSEISSAAEKGVFFVGVGVGPTSSYRERLLEQATLEGRGSTVYVYNADSADRELRIRYDQVMGIAYDDVRLQLHLPWYLHRIDEETPSGLGTHRPQYLAPGAQLTFLFRVQVCNKGAFAKEPATMRAVVNVRNPATQQEIVPAPELTIAAQPLEQLAPFPALDKALAIQSYVEALRSLDLKRVQRAKDAAARAGDQPDMGEINAGLGALELILTQ